MAIKTLDDLFTHMLQDVYYAENHIAKTLPEMMAKAANPMLKEGFRAHIEETRKDWEAKQADAGVPGATGEPDRAEEGGED